MTKKAITVVVSLDVEEEGLFCNGYCLKNPPVANLAHLSRLNALLDMGARPTLFCAHSVFASDAAFAHVEAMAQTGKCEVGAHLHHWNTPPVIMAGATAKAVPTSAVPAAIMAMKLDALLEAGKRRIGMRPTSFRMGKWDLLRNHWELLAQAGITADASVRPLHATNAQKTRPDHFAAPKTPYLASAGKAAIFELPLTVTPLAPFLPGLVSGLAPLRSRLKPCFEQWGALSLLPVYHPLWAMKAVSSLAIGRGQDVLSLTWHSSEMMPGGNPVLPDQKAIDRLMQRISDYLTWLMQNYTVSFMTLGELARDRTPRLKPISCNHGDWTGPSSALSTKSATPGAMR